MTVGEHVRAPLVLGAFAAIAGCGRIDFGAVAGTPNTVIDGAPDTGSGAPADACELGPWTTSSVMQPFGNVNSSETDWGVEISRDGLRLVFSSNRVDPQQQGRNYDLYMAERPTAAAIFDPAMRLPISNDARDDRDPTLSDDALELYFVADVNPGPCIYVSDRSAPTAGWSTPRRLDALCQSNQLGGPFLSRDGLRLYYDIVVAGTSTLLVASRDARNVDFAAAGVSVGAPGLRYCALDDSELTIYCESTERGNAQLWQATRTSTAASFSGGQPIPELGDGGMFDDGDPSLTADGLHLVYASTRVGTGNGPSDLYIAERTCQ